MNDPDWITLPYSAARRYSAFCMLILRAPRLAATGLGPWGVDRVYYRAGKTVRRSELWPRADAPRDPVLIESTISPLSRACPGGSEDLHVLWRFGREKNLWIEIARISSKYGEWWPYLHPLLVRELARGGAAPVDPDLERIASETAAYLDARIRDLTGAERETLLVEIHDQLARRIVAAHPSAPLTRLSRPFGQILPSSSMPIA